MSEAIEPVVRATGVGLRYRKTVALDSIDLELRSGTMTGFIGPDGVGKPNLLALIAGACVLASHTCAVTPSNVGIVIVSAPKQNGASIGRPIVGRSGAARTVPQVGWLVAIRSHVLTSRREETSSCVVPKAEWSLISSCAKCWHSICRMAVYQPA